MRKKTKLIITLGPSTNGKENIKKIKERGVDFVRVNMSHSDIGDLDYFIKLSKEENIDFVLDTEGSQIRTGDLEKKLIHLEEGNKVYLHNKLIIGNNNNISLKPKGIVEQLKEGDIIQPDFDGLTLKISDISTLDKGYIIATTIKGGELGKNKGVVIMGDSTGRFKLPVLSKKDHKGIEIGLRENVKYIAASFIRRGSDIDEIRNATKNAMKIISKIECIDALKNIDEIIKKSDALLIDRGDLSKEVPIEKIPFLQKMIISKAKKIGIDVFVATNLLETMVERKNPTKAEIQDIVNSMLDGATGLTLAAETAIGKYPIQCIDTINKIINHVEETLDLEDFKDKEEKLVSMLEKLGYLNKN